MGRRVGLVCSAVAFVALVARATGCTSSNETGPADCVAAGGQCQIPNLQCAKVGPEDCNPDRTTGGQYCCLVETDAAIEQSPATDATARDDASILASNYDQSCTSNSDCVEIYVGNVSSCEVTCGTSPAAISKSAEAQYLTDVRDLPPISCACEVTSPVPVESGPCCIAGTCQFGSKCLAADDTDADAADE